MDIVFSLIPKLNNDFVLLMVGGDEKDLFMYKNVIKDYKHKLRIYGFKSKKDLQLLYTAADVLIFPTKRDVWGLVINEALARGTQVISSKNAGGAIDLITDGFNGYIINKNNEDEYLKKIKLLFENDTFKNAKNALESINFYTIENMLDSHVKYLGKEL